MNNLLSTHTCISHVYGLTHWGRVTHICISNLTIIGSDNGFFAWSAPSHYLNQCSNIVNWALWNKLPWQFNLNSNISIQEKSIESVVCKMAAILSRPQCIKNRAHGLCFVVVRAGWFYPYIMSHPSELLHWHWNNNTVTPLLMKQPLKLWVNRSHKTT